MKTKLIAGIITVSTMAVAQVTDCNRFLIFENDKAGFIDNNGRTVISPQYLHAENFSEHLAAVRVGGYYGYIDTSGKMVIQPKFDYAYPFKNGVAIVYKGREAGLLQNKGQLFVKIPANLTIKKICKSNLIVATKTRKYGLMRFDGKLVTDTLDETITELDDSLFLVARKQSKQSDQLPDSLAVLHDKIKVYSVINTLGTTLIPPGLYKEIYDYENGIFFVAFHSEKQSEEDPLIRWKGFVDVHGKTISKFRTSVSFQLERTLSEGKVVFDSVLYSDPEGKSDRSFEGYMDFTGRFVYTDTMVKEAYAFRDHRALLRLNNDLLYIIDTSGNMLQAGPFDRTGAHFFNKGKLIARRGENLGIIDTSGRFISRTDYEGISYLMPNGGYFYYHVKQPDTIKDKTDIHHDESDRYKFGIAHIDGREIYPPVIDKFYKNGGDGGIFKCIINNSLCYINTSGQLIWKEASDTAVALKKMNIDYMNRGYFIAYSIPAYTGHGYYRGNQHTLETVTKQDTFTTPGLSVFVIPSLTDTIYNTYEAMKVLVVNNTKKEIIFPAQDNRLDMYVQAKMDSGEWKDIEYLPSSWCGHSYHTLKLPEKKYWTFVTPQYEGAINVKLRVKLICKNTTASGRKSREKEYLSGKDDTYIIYSNEYPGSINPAQLWRKPDYQPAGIMDPYNE